MAKRASLAYGTGGNDGFQGGCERRMFEEKAIATTTSFCFYRSLSDETSDVQAAYTMAYFCFRGIGHEGMLIWDDSTALLGLSV